MDVHNARVELLTRVGCHLCDEARDVVVSVCAQAQVQWRERDIDDDGDPTLVAQYSDYVPVVLVDGVQQAFWRVDAARLSRALGVHG